MIFPRLLTQYRLKRESKKRGSGIYCHATDIQNCYASWKQNFLWSSRRKWLIILVGYESFLTQRFVKKMLSGQHLLIVLDLVHKGVHNFCPQGKNFTFPQGKFHPYDVRISPKATLWISLHTKYAHCPLSRSATAVSLRVGHGSALTVHRTVIHYLTAALLPIVGA